MTAFRCLHCGSDAGERTLAGCRDYFTGIDGRFDYFTCQRCGLVQLFPVPADLSAFYRNYPVHARKSALHRAMRKLCMSQAYYLRDPDAKESRVLDFGCGDGWYLDEMAKRGWKVLGFEFDPQHAAALAEAHRFPVLGNEDELNRSHRGSFDLVTMHSVIEHLPQLRPYFRSVHEWLRPGGLFYFALPNFDCPERKLFGRKWHGLDPPRHVSFPHPNLIDRLASETGFAVVQRKVIGLPTATAGSLSAVLAGRYSYPLFAAMIPVSLLFCLLFPSNTLCFLLRKS